MKFTIYLLGGAMLASIAAAFLVDRLFNEPVVYEKEETEPELCFVESVEIDENGYGVFTDYGGKSYLFIKADGTVDVYEEAAPDRSNCIE